jgi:hypothetical protein
MSLLDRAQNALHRVADTAEVLEGGLKRVFHQSTGLQAPEKTRGQDFIRTVRTYATRLEKHPEATPASPRRK